MRWVVQVVEMEQDKGEWGFRALKQMIKLLFGLQKYDEMFERYRQLLDDYTATGAVTQNISEKGIDRYSERRQRKKPLIRRADVKGCDGVSSAYWIMYRRVATGTC